MMLLSHLRLGCTSTPPRLLPRNICLRVSAPPKSWTSSLASSTTVASSWIDRLPKPARPYLHLMRLDKPSGASLLYLPCNTLWYMGLFGAGALVMRGAGCTINDMWDRTLDKAVDRTKNRPLARGDITIPQAWTFLAAQLGVGLAVLLQLNWYSILLGAASLSVVSIYPFMKRITYWPQAVLGIAFNWGTMLGWSAVANSVAWEVCLPLYAGGIAWTLVYDSIYAHQDKVDDVKVGIRSTALLFGDNTRPILAALSTTSLGLISFSGYLNSQGPLFYGGMTLAAIQACSCWKGFAGCAWAGLFIWAGTFLDLILVTWT
ncbi:UbiA prenyltransferase family-domain-containing protein [Flagelloscypha sp. PMI_526]|nr:UbiA prenyltransferase family-domain-containing protein [Flagelloscypha sp. PMI_526]